MSIKVQEEIKKIVNQIVEKYKPEKIILFGSVARGNFDRDSDLDFLIIKKDVPEKGRERARELRKLIKKKFPADFFIYRPDEFEDRLRLGDPFIKTVLKEGKILYSA